MGKKALKCEERRNRDDLSQWMVSPLSVLGSSGKLRAHFGLFHSDKAGCPENPPLHSTPSTGLAQSSGAG